MKRYPFTIICVALIFYFCLFFGAPEIHLEGVPFIDKWTHFVMYGGTTGVFWLEYWHNHLRRNTTYSPLCLTMLSLVAPTLLGGLIEILQAYCTNGTRNGDWVDFWADIIGVLLGYLLGRTLLRTLAFRWWKKA